jgi:hypothetical protein
MAVNPRDGAARVMHGVGDQLQENEAAAPCSGDDGYKIHHSAESDTFLIRLPQINVFIRLLGRVIKGGFVTKAKSGALPLGPA